MLKAPDMNKTVKRIIGRLLMQDLDKDLEALYGINIKSISPYRDAYIISTSNGKKLLKNTVLSPDRILFIHAVKEHLFQKGFRNTDRYLCTVEGVPFSAIGNNICTVSDVMDGRECNFDDVNDVISAAKLLASLHKASKGFKAPLGCKTRDELGKLPSYFTRRLEDLKRLKNVARKEGSRFDYLFLKYFDYYYKLGELTIFQINNSRYGQLVEKARNEGVFCHHDYTYHNIICSENRTSVINFDYCCYELKVYDLANFIRRKMRKCNWGIDQAKIIIDGYCAIEEISRDEFEILKIILQFPQKYWRVANKYYNSKRSWTEKSYLSKLQEVIDEMEYHKQFIEKLDTLI
jgi:spore coat protein I